MPDTITITLSDGTQFTGELDAEGCLMLPRGNKPAEPWFGGCEAIWCGCTAQPELGPDNTQRRCHDYAWFPCCQYRIRPLPGRTWESIAAEAKLQQEEPAAAAAPNESDEAFLRRVLRASVVRTIQFPASNRAAATFRSKIELTMEDAFRLASMIGGGK